MAPKIAAASPPMMPPTMFQQDTVPNDGFVLIRWAMSAITAMMNNPSGKTMSIG